LNIEGIKDVNDDIG